MSASSVRGLRVYRLVGDGQELAEVPTNDNRYRVVRTIVDRALLILESGSGRRALWELGREIVLGRRLGGYPTMYPRRDTNFTQLGNYIDRFLRLMRSECPQVHLTNTEGEAAAVREDWAGIGSTLDDYRPQAGGHIEMHWMIIRDMTQTSNGDDFNMYLFQMTISLAHEMGHFLTLFLTGSARPRTPPLVSVPGAPAEAGFWWEVRALGGIVDFYSDPRRPNRLNQPGIPYLFPDGEPNSRGRRVSLRYIESLVAGERGFNLPIVVSSRGTAESRAQLDLISQQMSTIRRAAAAPRPTASSNRVPSSGSVGRQLVWQPSTGLQRYY